MGAGDERYTLDFNGVGGGELTGLRSQGDSSKEWVLRTRALGEMELRARLDPDHPRTSAKKRRSAE